MSTEQQDTREQQIEALAVVLCPGAQYQVAWSGLSDSEQYAWDLAAALLDGPVTRMIADAEQAAERRGAVKALRSAADKARMPEVGMAFGTYTGRSEVRRYLLQRIEAISMFGADL